MLNLVMILCHTASAVCIFEQEILDPRGLKIYTSEMETENIVDSYENIRNQRLLHNKQRFEDLGISKLSKSLSDLTKSNKKYQKKYVKPKQTNNFMLEPRRSSRARNPVPSYTDNIGAELPPWRKRLKANSSWASYLARPIEEVKVASFEQRAQAFKCAEKVQSNIQSQNPSFVKSMVRSHVYSCFWLGLPTKFCENHLPKTTVDMVLENEEGLEYETVLIGKRYGLSGGWRAFALEHKLDDGDALVFELIDPTRFKVYIVRAISNQNDDHVQVAQHGCDMEASTKVTMKGKKHDNDKPAICTKYEEKKSSEVPEIRRSSRRK